MSTLTHDQKRAKIAESLGWRSVGMHRYYDGDECQTSYMALGGSPIGEAKTYNEPIPGYLDSYDAAAQMRAALTEEERGRFCSELVLLIRSENKFMWDFLSATPAQQCEAFAKTRSLW